MADGHHLHEHLLRQEVRTLQLAGVLFFGYFGLELLIEGARQNFFENVTASTSLAMAWDVLVTVWRDKIIPVFVILDILLVLIAVFALVKVWPLKQGMTIFSLKPGAHGHGHEAHGHTHETHGQAQGAAQSAAAHTWNEALQQHGPAHQPPVSGNPATLKHWAQIVHRANTGTPENLRWAVLEADALVDHVLRGRGVQGETYADRLQNARWAGSKLVDKVFDAHRLRNELAHTPGFTLSSKQAERALFAYRDFLKELREF